ncbi:spindle pole body component alp6 [Xylariomycetidae sp. FL2044]|nr:spindle pole body component alp6 [Xylariomycetidae sp. FL2044]
MSASAQDRTRRINLSTRRLIAQIIPPDPDLDQAEASRREELLLQQVKQQLEIPRPPPLADQNHASELIRQKLVKANPAQALHYSNLYSRLLALPVLNQKWAMLYLLQQLADSPDPNEVDPIALAEFEAEMEEEARRAELDGLSTHPSDEDSDREVYKPRPTRREEYNPTELRDILKNPKKTMSLDDDSQYGSGTGGKHGPTSDWRRNKTSIDDQQPPAKRDVSIRSKLLADNYTDIEPSEPALLRDLPYTLQGLSSTTLPFGKGYTLNLPSTLPPPLICLLHDLAEPSLLFRTLEDFVKTPAQGLVGQSLRAAINNELRSYLTLVATLEGQIRRALATIDDKAPRSGIGKAGVTLKRCVVWTREATMGLRLMSLIAEESKKKKGGQLITLVHSFSSSHGDPIVGAFAERLLQPVTRPWYDILRHWIYDGELSDPYLEFFIQKKSDDKMSRDKSDPVNVWEEKFVLIENMIPSIKTQEFCDKVFLIGKSLNFIRHSCGDSQWVESYSKENSKELRYGDTATLESSIDEAYNTTMRRLIHLMTDKFHLFDHLQGLKDYMLLGRGDFTALLLESLAPYLDRPAANQYRHTLNAQMDHAVRGSNAQHDSPEVLRRLDARMLQVSHGDIGWDCFTLEYKIEAPLDVVVSDWGGKQYMKVFNFLWQLKRVEFALSSTWRKVTTGSRGVLQTSRAAVRTAWKTTRGHLAEMVHFVGQIQYYILFEVIESSWTELQARLHKEDATLDDVITAHKTYLESITHKGLLGATRRRFAIASGSTNPTGPSTEEDKNGYMVQLGDLLRTMRDFRDSVDGLYSWSVSDFTQRQEADLLRHQDDDRSTPFPSGAAGPESEFPALTERIRNLGSQFRTKLQDLLGDLAYQEDIDLRFLGVAMNFNDVYLPTRPKVRATPAVAKEKDRDREREREKERDRAREKGKGKERER